MDDKTEKIISFFKKIFGEDFKLSAISREEGNMEQVTQTTDLEGFFMGMHKNTIWYDPSDGILYSYKPEEDDFFKKVTTNAWQFRYIFYPLYVEGWGYWWSTYHFDLYEKGFNQTRYKRVKTINDTYL